MSRLTREQWGEDSLYMDPIKNRVYRQIAGGLAWPAPPAPGFMVVMAEEGRLELESGQRVLWVLAEQEAQDLAAMYRYYREMSEEFLLRQWYGDTANRVMMHLFRGQQRQVQGEAQVPLVVLGAPYHDNPQALLFYVQTIQDLVKSSQKLLYLGENSSLPGNFLALSPEELTDKAADYPPVAALGYAVAALRIYGPAPAVAPEYQERESWNPFGGRDQGLGIRDQGKTKN